MNTEKLEKAKAAFDADDPQASALLHKQKHFAKPWDPQAYSEAPVVQPVEYFKTGLSSAIDGSVTTSMVFFSISISILIC